MAKSALLKSSLAKKYWMAATGLFLCAFLIGHLLGNLQLFIGGKEGALAFNLYAVFMTTNPVVKILSYLTYFSILFHAIDGLALTWQNRRARPARYAINKPGANSSWPARNMALLGTIVLVFIAVHMSNFWYKMHWGPIPTMDTENGPVKDLYHVVYTYYQDANLGLVYTLFYVICMVFLGIHLAHGFKSAFQSLGINHSRYNPLIKKFGLLFSIIVPLLFAGIPLYIHFIAGKL